MRAQERLNEARRNVQEHALVRTEIQQRKSMAEEKLSMLLNTLKTLENEADKTRIILHSIAPDLHVDGELAL